MQNPKTGPLRAIPSTYGRTSASALPEPPVSVEERVRRAFADREQEIEEIATSNPQLARRMKADLDQLRRSIITEVHDARVKAEQRSSSGEE